MTAGWCSRTVRAAVFAAVCVLLAALGHVMMSGSQVPAWTLAVGLTVTGAAGWCLAGRERGLPLIVTVAVAAQTALHSAFSLAQSVTGSTAPMDMSDMGAVHMDMASIKTESIPVWLMTISHMGMSHTVHMGHSTDGGSSTFGMLAAHLLAALLSGLWLAFGEKAVFRILRAVAGWLAGPLRLLLLAPPIVRDCLRVRVRSPQSDHAPRLLLLVHAITSRGPPAGTAVI
ncbi:hypothetical protein [Streptomyces sp. NRRL S-1813]|uniref:hypothetical protein n=1 Tax=Streptomyces sp. NRRL S-1813 TaxID=1463888 RepID=UPI0004C7893D|nr:hypothetical protein [Streptomyces sp. NRRL S-1813]